MTEIESEKVFVRLEPAQSIESKRKVLGMAINLIQAQIASKKFGEIRKAELKMMRQIKTDWKGIQNDVDKILEGIPKRVRKEKEIEKRFSAEKRAEIGWIAEGIEKEEIKGKSAAPKISGKERKYREELEKIKFRLSKLR